jgi:hypothetical protein
MFGNSHKQVPIQTAYGRHQKIKLAKVGTLSQQGGGCQGLLSDVPTFLVVTKKEERKNI